VTRGCHDVATVAVAVAGVVVVGYVDAAGGFHDVGGVGNACKQVATRGHVNWQPTAASYRAPPL